MLCSRSWRPRFIFLHHATQFPHARSPISVACLPFLACLLAFSVARLLFIAARSHCPLAVSRTPDRCFPHARSTLFGCTLAVYCTPARCLMLPPPPRACSLPCPSSSASPSPPPRPHLCFASPAKPSQAPNMIKTGYRMSRVWIWSSENGRQGGVGQPSQEWYRYDEETNSIRKE
jgi:hypothetical protein